MGLFTDIYNTVAKFFRPQEEAVDGEASKSVATNRLKLVLMQDRTNLTPKVLEQMRGELVDLLSKYLEMDKELLELNFEQEGDQVALMLSIPVIRAKDEDEIEGLCEDNEEEISEEDEEDAVDDDEDDESEQDVSGEETMTRKKKHSKKVTAPDEMDGPAENSEHNAEEAVSAEG